jgi:cyclophilin family peptidyl-prolyl cis-trans isomerase/predicted  nucleic acid-binding Zn-ribbon protein
VVGSYCLRLLYFWLGTIAVHLTNLKRLLFYTGNGICASLSRANNMSTTSKHTYIYTILLMSLSAILGGYITSTILDQEYKQIFAEMQKDCQQSQNEYLSCRSNLVDETYKWSANIRACQARVERYIGEAISAYKLGSDGLDKAINRTQDYEQLQHAVAHSNEEVEGLEKERAKITRQLQTLQNQLETAEKELEVRDLERAECDTNYRTLITCEDTLNEVTQDRVNDEESSSLMLKQLSGQVQALKDQGERKEAMLQEMGFTLNNAEKELQSCKAETESIIDKVDFRSRRNVVKQYGPGPHYVRMSIVSSPSSPNAVKGNILLKLAPLDMMPHTIEIFLKLIEEKLYVGGTFILARDHILAAGPFDLVDGEKNQRMEEEMVQEGYFPNGALLFQQYTDDYPHRKYSVGFNKGGPLFYINIEDNTDVHGPKGDDVGDPVFATVIEGFDVIESILASPRKNEDSLETQVHIIDTYVMKAQ